MALTTVATRPPTPHDEWLLSHEVRSLRLVLAAARRDASRLRIAAEAAEEKVKTLERALGRLEARTEITPEERVKADGSAVL